MHMVLSNFLNIGRLLGMIFVILIRLIKSVVQLFKLVDLGEYLRIRFYNSVVSFYSMHTKSKGLLLTTGKTVSTLP